MVEGARRFDSAGAKRDSVTRAAISFKKEKEERTVDGGRRRQTKVEVEEDQRRTGWQTRPGSCRLEFWGSRLIPLLWLWRGALSGPFLHHPMSPLEHRPVVVVTGASKCSIIDLPKRIAADCELGSEASVLPLPESFSMNSRRS
jgi:hypothetical protein